MNITGGAGNDVLTSRTGNPNDGFTDTLNGGLGNDTLTVGGGIDTVDGGVGGDDLLVIDYATDTSAFGMISGGTVFSTALTRRSSFTNIRADHRHVRHWAMTIFHSAAQAATGLLPPRHLTALTRSTAALASTRWIIPRWARLTA